MSSCFSRCLRVPIAMRRFYEQSLWIPQNFLFTNLDLHHGLLGIVGAFPSCLAKLRRALLRLQQLLPRTVRQQSMLGVEKPSGDCACCGKIVEAKVEKS